MCYQTAACEALQDDDTLQPCTMVRCSWWYCNQPANLGLWAICCA